jgi:outer membrane lipoprotein SlyB
MRRTISAITAATILLAGCATPVTQQQLAEFNAGCAAGNPNACYAAQLAARQSAFEAQQNARTAAVGLAVLGGVAAGIAASRNGYYHSGYYYHAPYHYHHHWYRY